MDRERAAYNNKRNFFLNEWLLAVKMQTTEIMKPRIRTENLNEKFEMLIGVNINKRTIYFEFVWHGLRHQGPRSGNALIP